MKKTKASPQNRFFRIITVPVRALGKARDMYVKSMTDYADKVNYSKPHVPVRVSGLPKSFSVNSVVGRQYDNNDDFRELVRAASARSLANLGMSSAPIHADRPRAMPPRSSSVAMGRIDEDSALGEDVSSSNTNSVMQFNKEFNYPRSKSHAITRPRRPF